MRTFRVLSLVAATLALLGACASNDGYGGGEERRSPARMAMNRTAEGPELLLPAGWWHDSKLADPLALTSDQLQRLDALTTKEEEVASIERDGSVAANEFRNVLDSANPATSDIVEAGRHLREMRASLLEHRIALVAAERAILSQQQWQQLQQQISQERRQQRQNDYPRRPGMGGRGGRRPF